MDFKSIAVGIIGTIIVTALGWLIYSKGVRPREAAARDDGATRNELAFIVLGLSILGIVALSVYTLAIGPKDTLDSAKYVFSAVLPLLATWAGTVLAYYYQRENLVTATKSVTDLAQQITSNPKLSRPVRDVMLARAGFVILPAKTWADIEATKLNDALDLLSNKKVQRLPLLDDKDCIKYVIHKGEITGFMAGPPTQKDTATIKDLLADPAREKLFESSFATVGPDATIADVKAAMDRDRSLRIQDVFVTSGGSRTDRVVGWITNNDVERLTKA